MNENNQSPLVYVIPAFLVVAIAGAVVSVLFSNPFGDRPAAPDVEMLNLAALTRTDPALVMYDEVGSFESGFDSASCIALAPDGDIYIGGQSGVRAFSSSGAEKPFAAAGLTGVQAIAISPNNELFVSLGSQIQIYDLLGRLQNEWALSDPGSLITAFAFGPDSVFVADAGTKVVHECSMNGEIENTIGDFIIPSPYLDISIDSEGRLIAVNPGKHRIETFNDDGDLIAWWGGFSMIEPDKFCGCCNPVHFALLPGGDVITSEKGISRVKRYSVEGEFLGYVAGPDAFEDHDLSCISLESCFSVGGNDVAVDSNGRITLLGLATGQVRFFEPRSQGDAP